MLALKNAPQSGDSTGALYLITDLDVIGVYKSPSRPFIYPHLGGKEKSYLADRDMIPLNTSHALRKARKWIQEAYPGVVLPKKLPALSNGEAWRNLLNGLNILGYPVKR